MSRIELRPSVAADLAAMNCPPHPYRLRFMTMFDGEEIVGVGGLVFRTDGTVWVAVVLKPAARKAKVALHRAVLEGLREARARGIPKLFALADPSQPRSEAWLRRCGFVPTELFEPVAGSDQLRRIWQWSA